MSDSFSNSVQLHELLDIFRCGLCALAPVFDRAGIPWTEGDSYDDWDAVSSELYEQIVLNTVRDMTEVDPNHDFPKYDILYPSYDSVIYFEIFRKQSEDILGPFVGFEASEPQFSNVKYAISSDGISYDTTTSHTIRFADCGVRLRLPGDSP